MRSGFKTTPRFLLATFGPTYDLVSARSSIPVEIKSACGVSLDIAATTEDLTLVPFHRPFMSPSQLKCLYTRPAEDATRPVRAQQGGRFMISAPRLRYCAACCAKQHRVRGFVTWLRAHNLPGVGACWAHGWRLESQGTPPTATVLPPLKSSVLHRATAWEHWYSTVARDFLLFGGDALTANQRALAWLDIVRARGATLRAGTLHIAREVLGTYPEDFLIGLGVTPTVEALAPRIRQLTVGQTMMSPVLAILLAHVTHEGGLAGFVRAAARLPSAGPRPDQPPSP